MSPEKPKPVDAKEHDKRYIEAILRGQYPPPNIVFITNWGVHIYQRDDGRWYVWPEESLA